MNTENKSLQRLQQTNLEMIKIFIQICEKHQLQYFALGGTLLGAVRHQGFIPWDDDVDLGMPRPDYEKFLQIAGEELAQVEPKGRYRLRTIDVDEEEYRTYICKIEDTDIKLLREYYAKGGVEKKRLNAWIDIMPLDGMPEEPAKLNAHLEKVLKTRKRMAAAMMDKCMGTSMKRSKKAMLFIRIGLKTGAFKLLNVEKLFNKFNSLCKQYPYATSNMVGNTYGVYKEREFVRKEIFGRGTLHAFEDIQICGPEDTHAYLTNVYGDYMQLPPIEARGGHEVEFVE